MHDRRWRDWSSVEMWISWRSSLTDRSRSTRDDIEEALNASRIGEVTGAGAGMGVAHLDFEVNPDTGRTHALTAVFNILELLAVGDSARVRPGDNERWMRLSERQTDRPA